MNDWVLAAIAFALSLTAFHFADKLIARSTGRARGAMGNLRSAIAFLTSRMGLLEASRAWFPGSSSVHRTATLLNQPGAPWAIHIPSFRHPSPSANASANRQRAARHMGP